MLRVNINLYGDVMGWALLLAVIIIDVISVVTLKLANGMDNKTMLAVSIGLLMLTYPVFAYALKFIPMTTGYVLWAGLGSAFAVIAGYIFLKETMSLTQLFWVVLIVSGCVGLQLSEQS